MFRQSNELAIPYERVAAKLRVQQLRSQIVQLQLARDELVFVECENIKAIYTSEVGMQEFNLLLLSIEIQQTRRKIEMIQEKMNRQEKVSLKQIKRSVKAEFSGYKKKFDAKLLDVLNAKERLEADVPTLKETAELKRLYRKTVTELYPDINPHLTAEDYELFMQAIDAYERADLGKMRLIAELIKLKVRPYSRAEESAEQLEATIRKLESLSQSLANEIEKIKSTSPYTMKNLVHNKDEIEARKKELDDLIKRWEESSEAYKHVLRAIIRKVHRYNQSR